MVFNPSDKGCNRSIRCYKDLQQGESQLLLRWFNLWGAGGLEYVSAVCSRRLGEYDSFRRSFHRSGSHGESHNSCAAIHTTANYIL